LSRYLMINLSIGTGKGGYYRIDKNEGRCKMNTFQYLLEVIMGAESPPVH